MKKRVLGTLMVVAMAGALLQGCAAAVNSQAAVNTQQESAAEPAKEAADEAAQEVKEEAAEPAKGYDLSKSELPETIKFAYINGGSYQALTSHAGLFSDLEDAGVKIEFLAFESGRDINNAFASNSVDIGFYGSSPISLGISGDLGYEAALFPAITGSAEGLVAKNDSGVKEIKDLVGKTVAAPFASTSHYSLLQALILNDIDPADVTILDMGPADIFAAWERGDIDAAYVWNPELEKLKENGTVLVDCAGLAEQGAAVGEILVVNKEFGAKYHDAVSAIVNGFLKANDIFLNDPDKAAQILAEALVVSPEEAKSDLAGSVRFPAEEIASDAYVGTPGNVGKLAEIIKQTADFHESQGNLDNVQDIEYFRSKVNPTYLADAIAHGR